MTETEEPYFFRSYSHKHICCCGNFFDFFGQVQRIHVRRCQEFGHVHRIQSSSFGHVNIPLINHGWDGYDYTLVGTSKIIFLRLVFPQFFLTHPNQTKADFLNGNHAISL